MLDILPAMSIPAPTPVVHRARFQGQVLLNEPLCREHFLLRVRVRGEFPATRPGQFVQLGCRPPDEALDVELLRGGEYEVQPGQAVALRQPELCGRLALLRRPFSLAGRGDDEQGTWLEVIHRVVGTGTQWLSELRAGDAVDLIGPLGNQFELPAGKSLGLLVGGGVGLPPMFYLAGALRQAGWDAVAFVGALQRDLLAVGWCDGVAPDRAGEPRLSVRQFAEHGYPAVITTDDGSVGLRGRITAGLEGVLEKLTAAQRAAAVVFTCGPDPMMHAVADLAGRFGVDCQVCLEQAMACGMGTCQSCVVKIEEHQRPQAKTAEGRPWRFRLACTDGPVFDSRVVVWR
jgi:dihydroorotate dehydrogenase electron transfer subunit